MPTFDEIRRRWFEPDFESADPDALDPISRYRTETPYRHRLDEEMRKSVGPLQASAPIPSSSPMGARVASLASGLQGLKSRITAPLRPVVEAVDVAAIRPAIPARTVRESVEAIPILGKALSRPSRRFGKLLEDVAVGLETPQSDSPFTPTFEKQRPNLGEIAPSRAIEMAAEFGPSWADLATGGTSKALGLGLLAAGSLKDVGKGMEAARGAKKIAKELKAVEKVEKIPNVMRALTGPIREEVTAGVRAAEAVPSPAERYVRLGALEPPDIEPPKLTQPFPEIPGKGVSRKRVAIAQVADTPDDFLRSIAGKEMVPSGSAIGMADAARNLQVDTQIKANEGAASLDGLLRGLKKLHGDDRKRVEKALATRLDFGVPTGSDDLDKIADGIDSWQRQRFNEVADALEAAGKPRPTERQFYLTHRNERFGDAIRKYEHDPNGAVDDVEALYRESKVESPGRDEIRKEVDRIYRERNAPSTGPSGRVASKSPHVEEARTLDVPGYVADVRRSDFKAGDLVRTLEAYNQETAFRLADIKHFGAEGENFTNWHNAVGNESVKSYMREYRQQLLNALSDDPFTSETGWLMSALRSYEASNKLGRAAIANSLQTLTTTLPKSMNTVGLRGAVNYAQALGKSLPSLVDRGEALAAARRMGAVYDHSVADIAGIEHKGFMGGLADWQLKTFGFVPTERFNNTLSFHAGRLYGEDLAEAFAKGNKQAASEARRLLSASPELADRFVQEAVTGKVSDDILDRMGFEFARTTQFRADPTTLPLKWVTPFGKTLFQFKGFGYQYNRFLAKEVFGPALQRGEVRPLVAWLATAGATTPATIYGRKIVKDWTAMKQLLKDDPKEKARFESALSADVTLQSLGLLGDAGMAAKRTFLPDENEQSTASRLSAIPEFLAGPGLGEPIRAIKEGVGWKRPADEMIASRLPLGPVVPTAETAARLIDFNNPFPRRSSGRSIEDIEREWRSR